MTVVSGDITIVTETPALVTEVRVHAPETRTFGDGVMTTLSAPVSYSPQSGEVLFNAAPGPAVLSLKSGSRPLGAVELVVGDVPQESLRDAYERAALADGRTVSELEQILEQIRDSVGVVTGSLGEIRDSVGVVTGALGEIREGGSAEVARISTEGDTQVTRVSTAGDAAMGELSATLANKTDVGHRHEVTDTQGLPEHIENTTYMLDRLASGVSGFDERVWEGVEAVTNRYDLRVPLPAPLRGAVSITPEGTADAAVAEKRVVVVARIVDEDQVPVTPDHPRHAEVGKTYTTGGGYGYYTYLTDFGSTAEYVVPLGMSVIQVSVYPLSPTARAEVTSIDASGELFAREASTSRVSWPDDTYAGQLVRLSDQGKLFINTDSISADSDPTNVAWANSQLAGKSDRGHVHADLEQHAKTTDMTLERLLSGETGWDQRLWTGPATTTSASYWQQYLPLPLRGTARIHAHGSVAAGATDQRMVMVARILDLEKQPVTPDHPRHAEVGKSYTTGGGWGYFTYFTFGQTVEIVIPDGMSLERVSIYPLSPTASATLTAVDVNGQIAADTAAGAGDQTEVWVEADYTGQTDATAAVQAAVDYASPLGLTVRLREGKLRLDTSVTMVSGMRLVGAGMANTTFLPNGVDNAIEYRTRDAILYDVTLQDFGIDGVNQKLRPSGKYAPSITKGIFAEHMRRITFRNLWVRNTGATGVGVDHVTGVMENIWAEGNGRFNNGEQPGGSNIGIGTGWLDPDFEPLTVSNCHTFGAQRYGIFVECQTAGIYTSGVTIQGCTARGNKDGFGDAGTEGTVFSNCHAFGNRRSGFAVDNGTFGQAEPGLYTKIIGCVSEENQIGVIFSSMNVRPLDGAQLISSSVFSNNKQGVLVQGEPNYEDYRHQNILIDGNDIWGNGTHGIEVKSLGHSDEGTVAREFYNFTLRNNRMWNNGHTGIRWTPLRSVGATITGNECWDDQTVPTQTTSMYVSGQHTDMLVEHNRWDSGPGARGTTNRIVAGTDWNTITDGGPWYRDVVTPGDPNAPTDQPGTLTVANPGTRSGAVAQTFASTGGDGMYYRARPGGSSWTPWTSWGGQ